MTKQPAASIFPLLWIMLFDHTSLNIAFPILTLLFFDTQSRLFPPGTPYAVRSLWYGVCVALPHLVNLVAAPLLSALSDEWGRKRVLLIGTLGAFLFAITAAFGIMEGCLSLLFVGRFIQGLFSRTNPIAQAAIGDISTPQHKVLHMGYLQLTISIGASLGPMIGGYVANRFFFQTLNFSLPYYLAALLGLISFLLTWLFFEETLQAPRSRVFLRQFPWAALKRVCLQPSILRISVILLFIQMSWSLYYQFMPPILKTHLAFNAHQLGFFVGLVAWWLALATSIGIRGLKYFLTVRQLFVFSLYSVLIGLLLNGMGCFIKLNEYLIWLSAIPIAMGDVIAYSCITALYSNAVLQQDQGKAMAVCITVVALVWSITGLLGGVMMSVYQLLPLFIAPVGVLLSILLVHRSRLF